MNLPNKISLLRILMIPIFVLIFLLNKFIPYAELIATIIFILAASTDFIDGYIARKYNIVTDLGKLLDPIADKLLVTSAFFLIIEAGIGFSPFTMICAIIILARELIISAFRQLAASKKVVMAADKLGKVKTVFQDVSLIILLPSNNLKVLFNMEIDIFMYIGFALLVLSTLITIISGINYIFKYKYIVK